MKALKKLLALTMALLMILSLTVSASAAETNYDISVPSGDDHTYEIYQIFTGELSGETLSDIKWGENGTGTLGTLVDEDTLDALVAVKDATSDAAKLEVIEGYFDDTSEAFKTVTNSAGVSVPAGYYLIKDVDEDITDSDTFTTYIVQIIGTTVISRKASIPEVTKGVQDTNDSTGEGRDEYVIAADHDIGDVLHYQLTGTVASNYADYDTYTYKFTDKMSEGLTLDADTVKVYVKNGTDAAVEITTGFEYTPNTDTAGAELVVTFTDLKDITSISKDSTIIVEYDATLNEDAVVGSTGNENTVTLEYSNNPKGDGTGKSEEVTSIVFTYDITVDKVDDGGDPLTGAEFTLEKKKDDGTWVTITSTMNDAGTSFMFDGLDDGYYRLVESKTPAGYNTAEPIYFKVTADHSNGTLTTLTVTVMTDENFNAVDNSDDAATITVNKDVTEGTLTTEVVNKQGVILPETGGIGTTIFYIVGGLLTLAAVVLLVTKKKMSAAE